MEHSRKVSPRHRDTVMEVTCVIGEVRITPDGDESPVTVAFRLIAEHDAPGTYSFITPEGYAYGVTVTRDAPQ